MIQMMSREKIVETNRDDMLDSKQKQTKTKRNTEKQTATNKNIHQQAQTDRDR